MAWLLRYEYVQHGAQVAHQRFEAARDQPALGWLIDHLPQRRIVRPQLPRRASPHDPTQAIEHLAQPHRPSQASVAPPHDPSRFVVAPVARVGAAAHSTQAGPYLTR